jgi:putative flavoprotein involved in K+ transport
MGSDTEAVVIGAGFGGAGAGRELKRRGIETVVLEKNDRVGEPWRGRYDSLRLNTLRWQSHMPGRRMPREWGRWPGRDRVAEYLESYIEEEQVPVQYRTEATRIDRDGDDWVVRTSNGDIHTRVVVVAPGYDKDPKLPESPGIESFHGELLHAREYRNPEPFAGRDVLVISAGNTGSEIAYELSRNGAKRVRAAMRSVPNIVPREVFGVIPAPILGTGLSSLPIPLVDGITRAMQRLIYGDLSKHGISSPTYGMATNVIQRSVSPVIDDGFIEAVKAGQVEIVPAVEAFDGPDVVLAGGERIQPEVVIAATGYHRGLEPLVGHLDLLKSDGRPTHNGTPGPPSARGIWFVGYATLIRGQLPFTRRAAWRVARAAAKHVRTGARSRKRRLSIPTVNERRQRSGVHHQL